jgi:hypothetical protein
VNEWRIVAVRDDDERPRRALDDCDRCEHSTWEGRRLEDRGLDRDEHLQINRVIAIGVLKGDALVPDVRGRMRREVRMHRCRMMIVVICVDVRVQEWRAHGSCRNGKRQPEREQAADHMAILPQESMALT